MSMQHSLPDHVAGADPRMLYCPKCSQQMRIAMATPGRDEGETCAYECACGHQELNNMGRPTIEQTMLQPVERDIMLAAVPSLRAFAISLSGNVDRADDLVQGTLVRAIANIDSFKPGTNMQAWLCTILRNLFRSEFRKRRREVEDVDGSYLDSLDIASRAAWPLGVRGTLRRTGEVTFPSTRGPASRRRVGLLLQRGGSDL